MRVRVLLGALAFVGTGLIAQACSGFRSEETLADAGEPEADSAYEGGAPSDAGTDSDSSSDADSGARFRTPTEVFSNSLPSLISARYSPSTGRLYYSLASSYVPTIFVIAEDGGHVSLTGPNGGFIGDAPSFTSIDFMYYVGPNEDGGTRNTLKFRVDVDGGTRWSPAGDISSESVPSKPYVLPNGAAIYYASPSGIVRATLNVLALTSEKLVTFQLRDPSAAFSGVNNPVVTPDETTIYFAVPDKSTLGVAHVWTARRGTGNPADAIFVDAHPLEIEGSSGSELPSWVSDDGNELLFSRAPGLNDAGVSVMAIQRL